MAIGEVTLNDIAESVRDALTTYQHEIDQAYLHSEKDAVDVGLKATISPGKAEGEFNHVVEINFIKGRIKDKFKGVSNEGQPPLFDRDEMMGKGTVIPFVDRRGPVGRAPRFKALGAR